MHERGSRFMLYPSIDELVDLVDSKYSLVVAAAKRARKLQEHNMNLPGASTTKNVSRALWEIHEGLVKYTRTREGTK
jgi:DNA-directed RNA polymerase subunit omega